MHSNKILEDHWAVPSPTWYDIGQRPQSGLDLANRAGILGHEVLIERQPLRWL